MLGLKLINHVSKRGYRCQLNCWMTRCQQINSFQFLLTSLKHSYLIHLYKSIPTAGFQMQFIPWSSSRFITVMSHEHPGISNYQQFTCAFIILSNNITYEVTSFLKEQLHCKQPNVIRSCSISHVYHMKYAYNLHIVVFSCGFVVINSTHKLMVISLVQHEVALLNMGK